MEGYRCVHNFACNHSWENKPDRLLHALRGGSGWSRHGTQARIHDARRALTDEYCPADQVFCLPVPEKAQRAHNFVVFLHPRPDTADGTSAVAEEQFVWTVPEALPKAVSSNSNANNGAADGAPTRLLDGETPVDATRRVMDGQLLALGKAVEVPDKDEFASALPQANRKGEVAFHVKAHVGSKEGEFCCFFFH